MLCIQKNGSRLSNCRSAAIFQAQRCSASALQIKALRSLETSWTTDPETQQHSSEIRILSKTAVKVSHSAQSSILGVFTNLRTATIRFTSVWNYAAATGKIFLNLLKHFLKICRENSGLIKTWQKYFTWKPMDIYDNIWLNSS